MITVKKRFLSTALFSLAVLLCLPPPATAGDFFPIRPGDIFIYDIKPSVSREKDRMIVHGITPVITNNKTYGVLELESTGNPLFEVVLVRSTEREMFHYTGRGTEEILFKEGPVGTTWQIKKRDGRIVKRTIEAMETVTVPAGTFTRCLKISEEQVSPSSKLCTREWVKPGFGMVKLANYDCPGCSLANPRVMELKEVRSEKRDSPAKAERRLSPR